MVKPIVIKIGGSTLGSQDTIFEDLVTLQKEGYQVVVVHGGGAFITEWLRKQGVETRFVRGLRVTDETSLSVVVAVLAGVVNSDIVAKINSLGGKAMGISGVDGKLLEARIQDSDLGLVGEVTKVNIQPVNVMLKSGYIPVIAPLGFTSKKGIQRVLTTLAGVSGVFPEHQTPSPLKGEGAGGEVTKRVSTIPRILNINADTAAAEIAIALKADKFIFLTDVPGVKYKSEQVIENLSIHEAKALIASGVAAGGMAPKLEACLRALKNVQVCRIIDGRQAHVLRDEIQGLIKGTTIAP